MDFLRTIEPSIADKIVSLPDSIPLAKLEAQLESVCIGKSVHEVLSPFILALPKASVYRKGSATVSAFSVGVIATSVEEAKQIVKQGADFVVIQPRLRERRE